MYNSYGPPGSGMWWFSSPLAVGFGVFIIAVTLWSVYWKGRSMWKAARSSHMGWFIALLLINTAGILDILYIYVFSKPKDQRGGEHNHDYGHHHDHIAMPPHHHDQVPMIPPKDTKHDEPTF